MRRRFLFALVTLLSLHSSISFAFTPYFEDVDESHPNFLAIEYLQSEEVLQGYSDGTFKPDQTVNRAELMKILVVGQGLEPSLSEYSNCYLDVLEDWYAPYVCYATEQGWVQGYLDGTFLPAQTVNKAEATKMLVNALSLSGEEGSQGEELYDDVASSDWFEPYVTTAYSLNLLEESGDEFDPAGERDRGSIAESMFRGIGAEGGVSFSSEVRAELLEEAGLEELIPDVERTWTVLSYETDGLNYIADTGGYTEDNDGIVWASDFGTGAKLRVAESYEWDGEQLTVDADDLVMDGDGVVSVQEYADLDTEDLVVFVWGGDGQNTGGGSSTDDGVATEVEDLLTEDEESCLSLLTEAFSSNPFASVDEQYLSCEMQGYVGYAEAVQGEYEDYEVTHDYGTYSMGVDQYLEEEMVTRYDFGLIRVIATYENPAISEFSDPVTYDYLILVSLHGAGGYSYIEETVQTSTTDDYEYYLVMAGPDGEDELWQTEWSGYESILGMVDEEGGFYLSLPTAYMDEELELTGSYTQVSTSYRDGEEVDSTDYEVEKTITFEDYFSLPDYEGYEWSEEGFDYIQDDSYSQSTTVINENVNTEIIDTVQWHIEPIN